MNLDKIEKNYKITFDGKIQNKKTKRFLKLKKCKNGYLRTWLSIDGKRFVYSIHRLVAFKFLKNYKEGLEVNHIDGNKKNNNYKNLEWVTHKENVLHSYKVLKRKSRQKYKRNGQIFVDYKNGLSQRKIAEKHNITQPAVCNILKRIR
jgi:hypothetical protein